MKRCKLCVIPESFPNVTFNEEGVCSLCTQFKEKEQYIPSMVRLKKKLIQIVDEFKSQNLKYHALVAFSGGKDSSYLIHILQKTFGLRILAVTFDNGYISPTSFSNIRNVLKCLNVDHILIKYRQDLMNEIFIQSASNEIYPEHLIKAGSPVCISCIRMVNNMALRVAIEKKIPMVMLGNSPGQLVQSENEIIFKDNKIPFPLRKNLFKPLADSIGDEIYHYLMLSSEEYRTNPFPYTINAFPLIGYDEEEIYRTIKTLGWKKPQDVDPNSTNCQLNALGIVAHKERYNFHPYDFEMSMLIRMGIIDRQTALKRVTDPENKVQRLSESVKEQLNATTNTSY